MALLRLPEVHLVDLSAALVAAWKEVFTDFETVFAEEGDYFARGADAMLSPANSFGIMDGGLDLAIRYELGFRVEKRAQKAVVDRFHGECPVGSAFVMETEHDRWPYLVVAPTMRVPEPVPNSLNAYLAFRAALLAILEFNEKAGEDRIASLVAPGLCTGVGQMAPRRCAAQMRIAYVHASKPARIPSYDEIHRVHVAMRSV